MCVVFLGSYEVACWAGLELILIMTDPAASLRNTAAFPTSVLNSTFRQVYGNSKSSSLQRSYSYKKALNAKCILAKEIHPANAFADNKTNNRQCSA